MNDTVMDLHRTVPETPAAKERPERGHLTPVRVMRTLPVGTPPAQPRWRSER